MEDLEKYRNSALRFLSFRPRSEKEIRDKLRQKKATSEVIERVIHSLKEHKFLNDEDFARWFIENRLRFRPKSMRIIKLELKQKGITQDIVQEAFANLEKSDNADVPQDDLESAKKLVAKKMSRYKGMEKQIIYQKLGAFLARKGFGWDTIKKSIDHVLLQEPS